MLFASPSLFHQLDSNINYMTPLRPIHDPGPPEGRLGGLPRPDRLLANAEKRTGSSAIGAAHRGRPEAPRQLTLAPWSVVIAARF